MNKKKDKNNEDEMRPEYDLSQLKGRVRGKYVERYQTGTNLILLESDVQAAFPDSGGRKRCITNVDKSCPLANARPGLNFR